MIFDVRTALANWWGSDEGRVDLPAISSLSLLRQDETTRTPIAVSDHPENAPRFKRTYSATILRGIQVKVSVHNGYGGVYSAGELTQPGGRWVTFDPDRIADKVIDPVLLPAVTSIVREMLASDRTWRREKPCGFLDETGTCWGRVS